MEPKGKYSYFDRDLSWLSFNERILMEAGREGVPVGEKLNFMGIFAANLDEFYRVRMPAILALKNYPVGANENMRNPESTPQSNSRLTLTDKPLDSSNELKRRTEKDTGIAKTSSETLRYGEPALLPRVNAVIDGLQVSFGEMLLKEILPELSLIGVDFKYNAPIQTQIDPRIQAFFYEKLAANLQIVWLADQEAKKASQAEKTLKKQQRFFPKNDQIYLAVFAKLDGQKGLAIIQIPTQHCGRFMRLEHNTTQNHYEVWLLDDIIRMHLERLFGSATVEIAGSYSFKLSRDADIDYKDEYGKDLAGFIQKQIGKRNYGLATRLLYDQQMPHDMLERLRQVLNCPGAALVKGGRYHNLRDLVQFPLEGKGYTKWPATRAEFAQYRRTGPLTTLLDQVEKKDLLISTPYQDYSTVLRYFNEASIDPSVTSIAVTIYRIASDSLIAQALMNAAKNGKSVTVFVELKARFDEANNIKWARKMKSAGVKIVYSIWALKVHAKIALVKRKAANRLHYSGIVATGNFNENTARLYADHILLTANKAIMADIETLMLFLEKRARPQAYRFFRPQKLLVAGFNLQEVFLQEIRRCTAAAKKGQAASITIKLNNLEEQTLIDALYEAANAGVQIQMMVRSICRLIPGRQGMSENIAVYRLVDRYLEHARVFIFDAGGQRSMYMGSADWMNRNIYRRIEVCCPVLDEDVAASIERIIALQFADQVHLVAFNDKMENKWVCPPGVEGKSTTGREAQREIYQYLADQAEAASSSAEKKEGISEVKTKNAHTPSQRTSVRAVTKDVITLTHKQGSGAKNKPS